MLTYAIGDIHGEFVKLGIAMSWIHDDARETPHRVIFLGDYIDRGPMSRLVIRTLRAGPSAKAFAEWIPLMGNHEDLMIGSLLDTAGKTPYLETWLNNGGEETYREYQLAEGELGHVDLDSEAMAEDALWMSQLPLFFEDEHRIYCHSGVVDPLLPMHQQSKERLLWGRPRGPHTGSKLVVHGHTPVRGKPIVHWGRLNLDSAACFGGSLSVAKFDGDAEPEIRQFKEAEDRRAIA